MQVATDLIERFEASLNPQDLASSPIAATILGYGEISTIFQIGADTTTAFKRMPLFRDRKSAEAYAQQYRFYCGQLTAAGLHLPPDETVIVEVSGRPVVLYIAQQRVPPHTFGHRLVHEWPAADIISLFENIVAEVAKVWAFNRVALPDLEIAIDGQLSNWALVEADDHDTLCYVDTSTPLFRLKGLEQLDPELLLQSAPGFLRWIIRWLFLADVMNRYYNPRQVYMDLAANLYKEQRPDLIPLMVATINRFLATDQKPLSEAEVASYYREDKLIWTLFLAFRRVDRWIKRCLLCRRYEFILPGKIKR